MWIRAISNMVIVQPKMTALKVMTSCSNSFFFSKYSGLLVPGGGLLGLGSIFYLSKILLCV